MKLQICVFAGETTRVQSDSRKSLCGDSAISIENKRRRTPLSVDRMLTPTISLATVLRPRKSSLSSSMAYDLLEASLCRFSPAQKMKIAVSFARSVCSGMLFAGLMLIALCFPSSRSLGARLDPTGWQIRNYSGPFAAELGVNLMPPVPVWILGPQGQPVSQPVTNAPLNLPNNLLSTLTDNNLSTFITLTNPAIIVIDMLQTSAVDRVVLEGSANRLNTFSNQWPNYAPAYTTPPLGLINVYVGNSPTNSNLVASYMVPYDAGNPVETEADIRFSPALGRYVRIALQTQVTWGFNTWPGFALSSQPPATNVNLNIGEIELYGVSGANAQVNADAVVVSAYPPAPLALAASDLSYYLSELEGRPVPIISPSATNNYPGTLYLINDLAPLAPNYATMMKNISSGLLPTNIAVQVSGRQVVFSSWPYRSILWSVWEFLEKQGVRWVYPDAHGDFVPSGSGVNLSVLPFTYYPPTYSIYANFDANVLEPWPNYQNQSVRQEFLYLWRNHWTCSENGMGPLGGQEIPKLPYPNVVVNSNYTEGFNGYPHNLSSVVPYRLLDSGQAPFTNWWGWKTTTPGSQVDPSSPGAPVFTMDNPALISWVASKMTNIAAAQPLECSSPLNVVHWRRPFNLLPLDASIYSQDPYTIASNGPAIGDPVPWVKEYGTSYSGMYYSFVTAVANQVSQSGSSAMVGALAYADVFLPPTNMPALAVFPTNVQVEVCLYGSPNLAMTAPANAGLKAALDGWHSACSHLATYDYTLLHTDFQQEDPRMPAALVAGTLARSQYLATDGALDGGSQANLSSLPYNPWNFYAYPRTRWNTNQIAGQIEQEFFNGYFREAATPMLAYYQAMENYQFSNNVDLHYLGYCYNITPGSFPIGVLATMQTNLLAAEQLATNWWVARRVASIAAGFSWIITNSPDNLAGVDLTDLSKYAVLNPPVNSPVTIDLTGLTPTAHMIFGNNVSWQNSGGDWWLSSPAQLQESFNFGAGTYQVSVTANGVAASGIWPIMNIYFGPSMGSATVNSITPSVYNFTFTVPAGVGDLVITFPNSNLGALYIDKIQITRE